MFKLNAEQLKYYLILLLFIFSSCNRSINKKNYIDYVDMLIGTAFPATNQYQNKGNNYINSGQTIPAVSAPFGMTQWTLQTQSSEKKCNPPYHSGTIRFQGFRGTHWLNGSCSKDYGSFTVFPTSLKNNYRFLPGQRETMYMYNESLASPAYLSILMSELNIMSEITATKRCAIFKFSWLTPNIPTIIIDINNAQGKGYIKIDTKNGEIYGYNPVFTNQNGKDKPAGIAGYFVAKFNTTINNSGTYEGMNFEDGVNERKNGKDIGAYVSFKLNNNAPVIMKIGTSFISIDNARKNLNKEIPDWDFEKTKVNLKNTWNKLLGKIDIESNNSKELTKFYSALYRSLLQPRLYSDVNGEYPGFANDTTIHKAKDFDYYGDFATWNSYRAQMPLLSLIAPHEYNDMIKSLIAKAEQGGWLPVASQMNNYSTSAMGDYSSAIIADACKKDFDFDYGKAYNYLHKNAFTSPNIDDYNNGKGRRNINSYIEFGYIPLEDETDKGITTNGQVSQTLDYAYSDWCVAQVAQKLGKTEDFNLLMARSLNYTNLFDFDKTSVCGKFGDGTFTNEFDAKKTMPYIFEGTPEQYSFFVPHDTKGLIELFGGKNEFQNKLNELVYGNRLWAGNEPSQLIPYLYNSVDDWETTQLLVKQILKSYREGINGLYRNDLGAQMSAWYIFSSIGFYPACLASNTYQLSSPIFKKVTLNLDKDYYPGGKIVLKTNSEIEKKIFTKVEWNGKKIKPVLTYKEIRQGGKLVFSDK